MTREEELKFEIQEQKECLEHIKSREQGYKEWADVVRDKIDKLEKQLAELEVKVYRDWLPEERTEYYYIDKEGNIDKHTYNTNYANALRENSPLGIFPTEEQAKKAYDRHMAGEELKKIISEENAKQGWKVDWKNGNQWKYSIDCYNHINGEVSIDWWTTIQEHESELYFSEQSSQDQDFLDKIKPLWLKWKGIE